MGKGRWKKWNTDAPSLREPQTRSTSRSFISVFSAKVQRIGGGWIKKWKSKPKHLWVKSLKSSLMSSKSCKEAWGVYVCSSPWMWMGAGQEIKQLHPSYLLNSFFLEDVREASAAHESSPHWWAPSSLTTHQPHCRPLAWVLLSCTTNHWPFYRTLLQGDLLEDVFLQLPPVCSPVHNLVQLSLSHLISINAVCLSPSPTTISLELDHLIKANFVTYQAHDLD